MGNSMFSRAAEAYVFLLLGTIFVGTIVQAYGNGFT
jgi:hypothetical protein